MTPELEAYLTALRQQETILMVIIAITGALALIWLTYSSARLRIMRWFAGWPFWTLITLGYLVLIYALAFWWPALERMAQA